MLDEMLTRFVAVARMAGFNYGFLVDGYERGYWLDGIRITAELSGLAAVFSLLVGVLLATAATSNRRWLVASARGFIELTRNTPTLVQLYCAFLVLNMLISQALGGNANNPLTPFAWVLIVISLHVGAFHAESLRAGIEAVPNVTIEAAAALGFRRRDILLLIELPLALRTALPSLINNMINLVKLTTIGSAIAVGEITYASIMIWTQRDNVIELMVLILLLFTGLNTLIDRIGRWIENRIRIPGYGV
jgi:polar amino acid transport system permease protein